VLRPRGHRHGPGPGPGMASSMDTRGARSRSGGTALSEPRGCPFIRGFSHITVLPRESPDLSHRLQAPVDAPRLVRVDESFGSECWLTMMDDWATMDSAPVPACEPPEAQAEVQE